MAIKPVQELDTKELQFKCKTFKTSIVVMGISILIMAMAAIYLYTKQGFSVFTFLPLFFTPMLIMNIQLYRKHSKELNNRNL
jgi:hypothetical protein